MSILLVKRNTYPFKDMWCLPGGFLNPLSETLEDCAKRVLLNETNLKDIYLEQLFTFDDINRDPRMRVISTSFIALNKLNDSLYENACWFDIDIKEKDDIVEILLYNQIETLTIKIQKELKHRTTERFSYNVINADKIAFDHSKVILSGIERLKNKIEYTDIVFNMMSDYFTLGELQKVYEYFGSEFNHF